MRQRYTKTHGKRTLSSLSSPVAQVELQSPKATHQRWARRRDGTGLREALHTTTDTMTSPPLGPCFATNLAQRDRGSHYVARITQHNRHPTPLDGELSRERSFARLSSHPPNKSRRVTAALSTACLLRLVLLMPTARDKLHRHRLSPPPATSNPSNPIELDIVYSETKRATYA